jgi:hypothetical protein
MRLNLKHCSVDTAGQEELGDNVSKEDKQEQVVGDSI